MLAAQAKPATILGVVPAKTGTRYSPEHMMITGSPLEPVIGPAEGRTRSRG
jgi:hypothetical protein